jgi:phosphoserine phosphatase
MSDENCRFFCYKKTRTEIPKNNKKIEKLKMVVFDMDGVLTDIQSSWKHVHDYFNTCNDESVDEYLKGNIDDAEFIKRDADLWRENGKPLKKERLGSILSDVPLMNGAKDCIKSLHDNNVKTAIVSAGIDVLAERVGNELGIDYIFSNGIKEDLDGYLNGDAIVGVRLMYKDKAVKKLAEETSIPIHNIAAVGNSCYDTVMFDVCGFSIAFNPDDECVKKAADFVVEGKNLAKIVPFLEPHIIL